jgi:hypothetical protein
MASEVVAMKRKAGRPPRDYSDDPDVLVAELAIALQAASDMSARAALDFALAILEAAISWPTKRPRGARVGLVASYVLPSGSGGFPGRARDIRRKLRRGKLHPDAGRVLRLARLLHRVRKADGV